MGQRSVSSSTLALGKTSLDSFNLVEIMALVGYLLAIVPKLLKRTGPVLT
jgi:hypothetical protein